MPGAIVQTAYAVNDSGSGGTTTIAVTITGVTAGNTLVAFVGNGDPAGTTTVTVSDGASYTQAGSYTRDTVNTQMSSVFYLENAGSGSHTVTATLSSARDYRRIRVIEISGLQISSSLDGAVSAYQASPGTGTDGISAANISLNTNANNFLLGLTQNTGDVDPGSGTLSAGTNYTISGTNRILGVESRSVTSTGTYAATFTQSSNFSATTHLVQFKEAGGAPKRMMMMGAG